MIWVWNINILPASCITPGFLNSKCTCTYTSHFVHRQIFANISHYCNFFVSTFSISSIYRTISFAELTIRFLTIVEWYPIKPTNIPCLQMGISFNQNSPLVSVIEPFTISKFKRIIFAPDNSIWVCLSILPKCQEMGHYVSRTYSCLNRTKLSHEITDRYVYFSDQRPHLLTTMKVLLFQSGKKICSLMYQSWKKK